MTSPRNLSRLPPKLTDILLKLRTDIFRNMNCVKVGQITGFDGSKKTASVQILFKRVTVEGVIQSYTVLKDVPVFTLQGGGGSIRFPIQSGDQCLLLFSDRNLDTWYKTGSESAPPDQRYHDLSDGIALVGVNSLVSSLGDYETDELIMEYSGGQIIINDSGLIAIKNQVTTLLTILEGLIDVIKIAAVTDETGTWPLNAASVAALEAYKLQIQTLLI